MSQNKKIILFYKNLSNRGGAELLILKEYKYLKSLGYNVKIVTFKFHERSLFAETLNFNDLIILKANNNLLSWFKLLVFTLKYKKAEFIVSSGRIEIYLVSLFVNFRYSIHIHQPLFMSSRDYDKYSIFLKDKFDFLVKNNPLKDKFITTRNKLSIIQKIKLNLQSALTILSYKKAHKTFVLSNYSKKEKKILFNIDAIVNKGAIENSIFDYKVKKILPEYKLVKFKFLTICRLDNTKRIDVLINSLKLFYKYEKNFVLLIAGNGPEKNYFEKLVTKYNLNNRIIFVGFIDEADKYDYLNWADLFISIDWADYTITTIEALALGTICLVSNEREIENKIIKTGLIYFTYPDAQNTSESLIKILKQKNTLEKLNLKKILNEYKWDVYCKNLLTHIFD